MTSRVLRAGRNLGAIIRVLRDSRFDIKLPKTIRPDFPCIILGNGPSLTEDIKGHQSHLADLELFSVGRFAEVPEFSVLRPKHYVFADPMYWLPNAPNVTIEFRERLFSVIASRTKWKMNVLAPIQARHILDCAFRKSPWIEQVLFNVTPVSQDLLISKYVYDHNLGMHPVQNVLVACLFLALRMGHKNIVLLGADHSWHETLALGDGNQVCLRDRHFYDKEVELRPFTMDGSPDQIFTMDRLFFALGRMFEGYWSLARYAETLGATIRNASSTTYIDAFPRTSLATALNMPSSR